MEKIVERAVAIAVEAARSAGRLLCYRIDGRTELRLLDPHHAGFVSSLGASRAVSDQAFRRGTFGPSAEGAHGCSADDDIFLIRKDRFSAKILGACQQRYATGIGTSSAGSLPRSSRSLASS